MVTVVDAGAFAVDADVSIADIDLVKVGQRVSVTVDGRSRPVAGDVSFAG